MSTWLRTTPETSADMSASCFRAAATASRLVRSQCTTNKIVSAAGDKALTSGSPRTGGVSMITQS